MRKPTLLCSFSAVLFLVAISSGSPMRAGTDSALQLSAPAQPGPLLWDDPDGQLRKIDAPVACWFGVSVAVNCDGELFYTNYRIDTLYKMDAWGNLASRTPIVDSGTGAA